MGLWGIFRDSWQKDSQGDGIWRGFILQSLEEREVFVASGKPIGSPGTFLSMCRLFAFKNPGRFSFSIAMLCPFCIGKALASELDRAEIC